MAARTIRGADLFCGAGGTSTGATRAAEKLGLQLRLVCVNHWPTAIATHSANHPDAIHLCQDIATVRPSVAVDGGKLDILMASPTCTHHSRARGGRPTSDQQRMDPWHIVTWLTELRVARLLIENVPEFMDWGPVDHRTGKPIKSRKGEYFRAWCAAIRNLGFVIDHRVLNCADYGDATTRQRFFLIGRSDGKPLRWPAPSHARHPMAGDTRHRWRPAREIIDWSIKGLSIYGRARPLAPNTLKRILAGAFKLNWPEPWIVVLRNHMAARGLDVPLPTVTAGGTHIGLAQPIVFQVNQSEGRVRNIRGVEQPLQTVVTRESLGIAEPIMLGQHFRRDPKPITGPVPAITTVSRVALVEPFLLSRHADGAARPVSEPSPTQVAKHSHMLFSPSPLIAPYYGSGSGETCVGVDVPLPTVTAKARFGMVMPITHSDGSNRARDVDHDPVPTITTANRGELAFITASFGERDGQAPRVHSIDNPVPTICAEGRTNLVEPGVDFDILYRMLEPHELAAAMSFPASYAFTGNKTETIRQIGGAVPGETSEALVTALCADLAKPARSTRRKTKPELRAVA